MGTFGEGAEGEKGLGELQGEVTLREVIGWFLRNSETLLQAGAQGRRQTMTLCCVPFTTSYGSREKSGSVQVGMQAGIQGSGLLEWAEHGKQGQ